MMQNQPNNHDFNNNQAYNQNANNIDFNVYIMAMKSGNMVDFLRNVENKAPYVKDEITILTAPREQQEQFLTNVCSKLNMSHEQFLNFSNQLIQKLINNNNN